MRNSEQIRTEPDPILREIYAAGYDQVLIDRCTQDIILLGDNIEKRIAHQDFVRLQWSLSFCTAILIDGTRHTWVKEGDGSCERLRKLITPE